MAAHENIATVVYADLSGFTTISEKLDPEDVTTLMNRCFEALEAAVVGHGGSVNKYIGDCLLAIFGLDEPPRDGAQRAVAAAVEMLHAIAAINRQGGVPGHLDIHVGVATGPVIPGEVGGSRHREFTVTGDTVTLAERLEDISVAGQILVGPTTRDHTCDSYEYRECESVLLPGRTEPVPAYVWTSVRHRRSLVRRGSERRQATVIFAKLTGLEKLAGVWPAEDITALINRFFSGAEEAIVDNGGVVDKYIGTTLMALFGVPRAIEDAPLCAVRAALEIRERVARQCRDEGLDVPIDVRAGINSGLVIAGEIGGRIRRDFTVMGDTVNLAARFAEMCPPGSILIGPTTYAGAPGAFTTRELPPVKVKGRAAAIPVFDVLGHAAARPQHPHRGRQSRAEASPLVGRLSELDRLQHDVAELAHGRGGVTSVSGEAGLGKSRLLAEILRAPSLAGCRVLAAHASPIGANLSFAPFTELLRGWAEIAATDEAEQIRTKLAGAIAHVGARSEELMPFLARMMGVAGGDESAASGDADALERLIFRSVRELLQQIAAQQPVLFVFEDVHWADQSSRSLLGTLLRSSIEHPIRFLLTFRPQPGDELRSLVEAAIGVRSERYTDIRLAPLVPPATGLLVEHLVGTEQVPSSLRRLITEKSEGNPFFVEEVVRSLFEQGVIVAQASGPSFVDHIESLRIPATVEEVVMSRVDRLDEPSRHSLQAAAVIGRSFSVQILEEILRRQGYAGDGLAEDLAALVERRLLVTAPGRGGDSGAEYYFEHALAQQTIYESLLQQTRRELHGFVAAVIEDLYRDRLTDVYGMLALHYSRAGDLERAEDYLFRAGEAASRSAATREALAFFQEASRLYLQRHGDGGDPFKKAVLENHVGVALLGRGQISESIEHFDTALGHLGVGVPREGLPLYLGFAGDLVVALARLFLRGGVGRGQVSEREKLQFHLVYNRSRALTTSDPQRLFIDNVGAVRRVMAVDARDVDEAFGMYVMAATLFGWSGRAYGIARRFSRIAAMLVKEDDVGEVFVARFLHFGLAYLEGDWAADHILDDRLVDRALHAGRFWDVQTYLGLACDRLLRRGEFDAAAEHLRRLAEIRDVYEYGFAGSNHDGMSALVHLEARRLPEARTAIEAYAGGVHDDPLRVLAYGTRAKIETLAGALEAAATALREVERVIERSPVIPPWHLSAYTTSRLLYDLLMWERDRDAAGAAAQVDRSCRRALAVAGQVALPRVETYRLAARWAWARGRKRRALRAWQRALACGRSLGAEPETARTLLEAGHRLEGQTLELDGMRPSECRKAGEALLTKLGIQEYE